MATSVQGGSATIHQFPPRGRYAVSGARGEPEHAASTLPVPNIVFGSGWYHDEAIEAERAQKN